jgi:hypothetical protein
VTYAITWESSGVDLTTRFLVDDPGGLRAVMDVVDALTHEPHPPNAFPVRRD